MATWPLVAYIMAAMARPAPSWLPPLSIAAMALMIALVSIIYHFVPLAVTAQLALLLVLLRAFWYWPPMNRWLRTMPAAHRIVFGLLLAGMILGHFSLNGRSYFPFVVWEIFPAAHVTDPVTCREFIGRTATGERIRLLPEQIFPSIVQVDPIDSLDDPSLYPPGTTAALAQAMGGIYNAHHPTDMVSDVDLVQVAVPLHPPAGQTQAEPSCELLKSYSVLPDRWR